MRTLLIAAALLPALAVAGHAQAPGTQPPDAKPGPVRPLHAAQPNSAKAKSRPRTSPIPGASTTGGATTPPGAQRGTTQPDQ